MVWVEFEAGDPGLPDLDRRLLAGPRRLPAAGPGRRDAADAQHPPADDHRGLGDPVGQLRAKQVHVKTPTGAMIMIGAAGITISNGQGASIAMAGPSVIINNGALIDHLRARRRCPDLSCTPERRDRQCPHGAPLNIIAAEPARDGQRHAGRRAHRPGPGRRLRVHWCGRASRSPVSPRAGSSARRACMADGVPLLINPCGALCLSAEQIPGGPPIISGSPDPGGRDMTRLAFPFGPTALGRSATVDVRQRRPRPPDARAADLHPGGRAGDAPRPRQPGQPDGVRPGRRRRPPIALQAALQATIAAVARPRPRPCTTSPSRSRRATPPSRSR